MAKLGECYANGDGVEQNISEASHWYNQWANAIQICEENDWDCNEDDEDEQLPVDEYFRRKTYRNNKDKNDLNDSYGKAKRKIPKWARKPEQFSHKIIKAYFEAEEIYGEGEVTLARLEQISCEFGLSKKQFRSAYARMTVDAPRTHGKLFEDDGYYVCIWDEVESTLLDYKNFFCESENENFLKPKICEMQVETKSDGIEKKVKLKNKKINYEKYDTEIQEKEKIIVNLKNEIEKLVVEKMNLKESLEVQERLIDENTKLKKENNEISMSIATQKDELEKLKDEITLLERDKANIIVEQKRMINSKNKLNNEIEKLINRKQEYLEKMTEYEYAIIDMEQEQQAILQDIERLKQEYNNLVVKEAKNYGSSNNF